MLSEQKLNKVLFILSPLNPFKIESKNILLEVNHRYEILKLATKKYKNMIPSDIEFGMKNQIIHLILLLNWKIFIQKNSI